MPVTIDLGDSIHHKRYGGLTSAALRWGVMPPRSYVNIGSHSPYIIDGLHFPRIYFVFILCLYQDHCYFL